MRLERLGDARTPDMNLKRIQTGIHVQYVLAPGIHRAFENGGRTACQESLTEQRQTELDSV